MTHNFIQSHARTSHGPNSVSADHGEDLVADPIESATIATRRLEEALLRLDRAATSHRPHRVAPSNSQPKQAPPQRSLPRQNVELDESISSNASMWLETTDDNQLRIDPAVQSIAPDASAPRTSAYPMNPTQSAPPSPPPVQSAVSPAIAKLFETPIDVMLATRLDSAPSSFPPAIPSRLANQQASSAVTSRSTNSIESTGPNESTNRANAPEIVEVPDRSVTANPELTPFVAAWQVESFPLPESVEELFLASGVSDTLATRLCQSQKEGLRTIAVTSVSRGEGRSSVALGLALSVAAAGLKVVLVDADGDAGTLAGTLSLELDNGWIDALRTGMPLTEVAVYSHADRLTLVPLREDSYDNAFSPAEMRQILTQLSKSFDLVLVDTSASATAIATLCDTALIVRDVQSTSAPLVENYALALRRSGSKGIGIVENFCS